MSYRNNRDEQPNNGWDMSVTFNAYYAPETNAVIVLTSVFSGSSFCMLAKTRRSPRLLCSTTQIYPTRTQRLESAHIDTVAVQSRLTPIAVTYASAEEEAVSAELLVTVWNIMSCHAASTAELRLPVQRRMLVCTPCKRHTS